jgi:DNA-directed RNA polymerase subunit L
MAEWVKNQLNAQGAANYLAYSLNHPDGNRYAFTLQRVGGLTPAEKIADQAAQIDELQSDNVTLRAKTTDLRSTLRTSTEAHQVAIDECRAEIARLRADLTAVTAERDAIRDAWDREMNR